MDAEIDSKKCGEAGTQAECPPVKVWFECPHCERQLDIDAQLEGNQERCPGCSFQFQSPRGSRRNTLQTGQKKMVLIGGFILGLAVLSAGLWMVVARLGSTPETRLRVQSQAFWQDQEEDPASVVDYVQFETAQEKEKVRQLLKEDSAAPYSIFLPCTLEEIEVSGSRGVTHFAGKKIGARRPGFEMVWKYENDQWYLEKIHGRNVRESLLTRVEHAELSRLLHGSMTEGRNPVVTPELVRKFQEVMRPQIQELERVVKDEMSRKIEEAGKVEEDSSRNPIRESRHLNEEIRKSAAKTHLTPTETVKAFNEAVMKGAGGLDEAVQYCTRDAGEGWRFLYKLGATKPPNPEKIEYGGEMIVGDKATVEISMVYDNDTGYRVVANIMHLKRERGRWGIVGVQNKKSGFLLLFSSHRRSSRGK